MYLHISSSYFHRTTLGLDEDVTAAMYKGGSTFLNSQVHKLKTIIKKVSKNAHFRNVINLSASKVIYVHFLE